MSDTEIVTVVIVYVRPSPVAPEPLFRWVCGALASAVIASVLLLGPSSRSRVGRQLQGCDYGVVSAGC